MRTRYLLAAVVAWAIGSQSLFAETLWINRSFDMYSVDSAAPGTVLTGPLSYTGFVGGDTGISAFDFRPQTGVLYGYNYVSGRLYTIDTATAALTPLATSSTTPNAFIGMTFESANYIRIVHVGGAQFRIDPDTGALAFTDTNTLEDGLMGVAQNHNTNTTYGIEDGTGNLHRIGSFGGFPNNPSTGLTELIGPSGIFTSRTYNMDISSSTGIAYVDDGGGGGGGTANLWTVNLTTGVGTYVGPLAFNLSISNGIAVQPIPEPATILLLALGLTFAHAAHCRMGVSTRCAR